MAIYNNQNNRNEVQMNTKAPQYYGDNTTIVTGWWNSMLSIKIHPILPENKRSDNKIYDYEDFFRITPGVTHITALLDGLYRNKVIDKFGSCMIGEGEDFSPVSINVSKGVMEIGLGKYYSTAKEQDSICFVIYDSVDETCKTDIYLLHEFRKTNFFTNYKHLEGTFDRHTSQSDFTMFTQQLISFCQAANNAIAHSVRDANKFVTEVEKTQMKQVMEKLGISSGFSNNKSNNGFNMNKNGFSSASSSKNNDQVPTETYEVSSDDRLEI